MMSAQLRSNSVPTVALMSTEISLNLVCPLVMSTVDLERHLVCALGYSLLLIFKTSDHPYHLLSYLPIK